LDDALWGTRMTKAQIIRTFGEDLGADYALAFGNGDKLILKGVASAAGLADAIDIF
jgi:hypothetical protein